MPEKEVRELIEIPSQEAGLPLAAHAERILELSGRLPFFVQMASSAAFECLVEEGGEVDWDLVEQRFLEEAVSHFRYLWEHFDAAEHEVIATLAAGGASGGERSLQLKSLIADGYVEREGGRERLFSASFARFLRETVPELEEIQEEEQPAVKGVHAPPTVVEPVPEGKSPFPQIIGQSPAIRRVFALMQRVVEADITLLLTGETGTGKELVARIIHEKGGRSEGPFVVVNCGAIAENLQESELFGHRKGAFTDAVEDREGLFEAGDGGTVFLDEIGETSPATQVKLLRVLQEGEVRRVGENRVRRVNVRLICATNRSLEEEVEAGRFREDLYYRLYVLNIDLPPLRQRRGDIRMLIEYFLDDYGVGISRDALNLLRGYAWPGNIRELENQMASARAMAGGEQIGPEHLWPRLQQRTPGKVDLPEMEIDPDMSLKEAREEFEQSFLTIRLQEHGWKLDQAAQSLGLSRSRLYELIKRYGLKEG